MLLAIPIILLTIPLAGCPIWWEEYGHDEGYVYCDTGVCTDYYCYDNYDCPTGYYCDDTYCVSSDTCRDGECPSGYVCDIFRDTCIPVDVCVDDGDCYGYAGYCDESSGVCIPTDYCWTDADCAEFGESFVCSDRGVCEPDEGPCPDGHCGCLNDADCGSGLVCTDGLCHDPATLCVYDFECPAGSVCVNSLCRVDCAGGAGCPTGQVCSLDRFCSDDPDGGGQCIYASECAENQRCVNGYCTNRCADQNECGPFEDCIGGICRVAIDVTFECTSAGECSGDFTCVDHACRMPCAADINCASMGEFSRCASDNVCRTPNEIAAQCDRADDCAGAICIDGTCL
jgi:hypothetical protein